MRLVASGKSAPGLNPGAFIFSISMSAQILRVLWGTEGAFTPSQIAVAIFRTTAQGTSTASTTPLVETSGAAWGGGTVATAWSANPSISGIVPLVRRSFDVLAESEWVFEPPDELNTSGGLGGLAALVWDVSVPAGVSLTWTLTLGV